MMFGERWGSSERDKDAGREIRVIREVRTL